MTAWAMRAKKRNQQAVSFHHLECSLQKEHKIFRYHFQTGCPSTSCMVFSYCNKKIRVYSDKSGNGMVQKKGYLHLSESLYRHNKKNREPKLLDARRNSIPLSPFFLFFGWDFRYKLEIICMSKNEFRGCLTSCANHNYQREWSWAWWTLEDNRQAASGLHWQPWWSSPPTPGLIDQITTLESSWNNMSVITIREI